MMRANQINILLMLLLVAAAISQIQAQYKARRLFIDLEREQATTKQLDLQYSQLKLDHATYGNHARIENIASKQLNMVPVTPARTQYLKAGGKP